MPDVHTEDESFYVVGRFYWRRLAARKQFKYRPQINCGQTLGSQPPPTWAKPWGAAALAMVGEIRRKAHTDHTKAAAERRAAADSQQAIRAQRANKQTRSRENLAQPEIVFAVHRRLTGLGGSRKMVDSARAVMVFHDNIRTSGFSTATLKCLDLEGNPVFWP